MPSRVTLLCVGSLKFPWAKAACDEFAGRLRGTLDVHEIPAGKQKDPAKQRAEESAKLEEALEKQGGIIWVLDETGKAVTSSQFAAMLGKARDRGERVTLVLGGAFGLSGEMKKRGTALRVSDMTLPHELCRVVVLEQVYRAFEILKGSGYHH